MWSIVILAFLFTFKVKDAAFDYANIIVDGIFDLEQIAREKETKDALNAIDKEYNYEHLYIRIGFTGCSLPRATMF